MADVYKDFMELCAYEPQEIDKELPRLKKAFDRAGLTEEDVKRGQGRLVDLFQCDQFRGMRLFMGGWVKPFVDYILSKDEGKVRLFVELPQAFMSCFLGAAYYARKDIVSGLPTMTLMQVMGAIFAKIDNVLEWAEAGCMPPGLAHCGCNQLKIGVRGLGIMPTADLFMSCGAYCDEAAKADEALQQLFKERVYWLNRPQDEPWDEPVAQGRRLDAYAEGHIPLREMLSEVVGVEVTEEMLKQNFKNYVELYAENRKLAIVRAFADPQPLRGAAWASVWMQVMCNQGGGWQDYRMEAQRILHQEVQAKIDRGEGVIPKGAPRVMYAAFLPISTPEFGRVVEDAGVNLAGAEDLGTMAIDPVQMGAMMDLMPGTMLFALIWLANPYITVPGRAQGMIKAAAEFNLDGVLFCPHFSCRIYGSDFVMLKEAFRREMPELPVVIVDTDIYDRRYYNHEQARTRLESFAEVVKTAKAAKEAAKV